MVQTTAWRWTGKGIIYTNDSVAYLCIFAKLNLCELTSLWLLIQIKGHLLKCPLICVNNHYAVTVVA